MEETNIYFTINIFDQISWRTAVKKHSNDIRANRILLDDKGSFQRERRKLREWSNGKLFLFKLFRASAWKSFESMKLNHLICGKELATDKNIIFIVLWERKWKFDGSGKERISKLTFLSLTGKISQLLSIFFCLFIISHRVLQSFRLFSQLATVFT